MARHRHELALAQGGSLRAAARALNVTQPALTKSLQQLEEELGAALVIRTPRGVRLAPAGELLAARAAAALRELQRAREEIAWLTQHGTASVSVGLSPGAAIHLSPAAIARFEARWPNVRINVVDTLYPRMLAQLRAGELDMALGPLPDGNVGSDLLLQPLFTSRHVIAARRHHPLADARTLAELQGAAWILTGPEGGPGDPSNLDFASRGLPAPQVRVACESFATLLSLMPAMDVIGIMPQGFFQRYGPRLELTVLPIQDELPNPTIYILHHADKPLSFSAQRLHEAFVHEAEVMRREGAGEAIDRAPGPRHEAPRTLPDLPAAERIRN